MNALLTDDDRRFVHTILKWDQQRRSRELSLFNLMLLLAAILVIAVAVISLQNLTDRTVVLVTVPGLVMTLLLIGISLVGRGRIQDKHRVAEVLKKLVRDDG